MVCRILKVSRSGYYRVPKKKESVEIELEKSVINCFEKNNGNYGRIRMKKEPARYTLAGLSTLLQDSISALSMTVLSLKMICNLFYRKYGDFSTVNDTILLYNKEGGYFRQDNE